MRIAAVCSQLQMCFRFCDLSAVVSVYAVTVGLVWYGLSTLIHVSFFIFIISPSYFYRVFSRLNVLILLFLTEHPGGIHALVAGESVLVKKYLAYCLVILTIGFIYVCVSD